jgi:hypothetical protein
MKNILKQWLVNPFVLWRVQELATIKKHSLFYRFIDGKSIGGA